MDSNQTIEQLEAPSTDKKPTDAPEVMSAGLLTFVDPAQVAVDLTVDLPDLDNAIRHQASLFARYAHLASQARRQSDSQKTKTAVGESRLYALHREMLLAAGQKATEAGVDAAVKGDARWFGLKQKEIDARAIADYLDNLLEAIRQKKDMLVQSSVDRRTEQQGELRIMAARVANGDARTDLNKHIASLG